MNQEIVRCFRDVVGNENLIADEQALRSYELATFPTDVRVPLALQPGSRAEVEAIVRIAHENKLSIYPLSRGFNWGLGSKVPTCDGAVVVDLHRMDRIVSFNEDYGFIVIEPGVTFKQVSEFLAQRGSRWFLSVIGGHPHSSIVGNTIERGDGLGPIGDRSQHVSSLEVVLGDGSVLRCGLGAVGDGIVSKLTSDSLGPGLDKLFFQSNLGIVTQMTVWLKRRPGAFATVFVGAASDNAACAIADAVRDLQARDVVCQNSSAMWNIYKVVASSSQHPLIRHSDRPPQLNPEDLDKWLPRGLRGLRWLVTIALYAPTSEHLSLHVKEVRRSIGPHARSLRVLNARTARLATRLHLPLRWICGFDVRRWIDTFYNHSVYLGNTSELSVRSLYWRKKGRIPEDLHPERDMCGLLWLCHLIPFSGADIVRAEGIAKAACLAHGLEPNVAFLNVSSRYVRMFVAIMYDREGNSEDTNATECQKLIHDELTKVGYLPFRLGINAMHLVNDVDPQYVRVVQALKEALDPHYTVAPGRYDFSHLWPDRLGARKAASGSEVRSAS